MEQFNKLGLKTVTPKVESNIGTLLDTDSLFDFVKKFDLKRQKKELIGKHLRNADMGVRAVKYEMCGFKFKCYKCDKCKKTTLVHTDSCNLRICEDCCKKQYWRHKKRVWHIIEKYGLPAHQYRTVMLREITLTWVEPITEFNKSLVIKQRRNQINKFIKHFGTSKKGNRGKRILGSFKVFETKRSSRTLDRIHIHAHVLVVSRYIPHAELKEVWERISGNSIVYIVNRTAEHGLTYLLKHIYKPPELLPSDMPLFLQVFENRRRVTSDGCFYKLERGFPSDMAITLPVYCKNCGSELMVYEVKSLFQIIYSDGWSGT